ncbi:3644_t:CDS:2 [Ambispora leptoticha]|uniref:3644_t:CDS:1 n=1 Tax=Ambispora leptoticha TaxID=144679 RepID=A0A9N9EXQ0_9GLOM|nr:3644_t:CDS:2 [Ambispora leptoticha]
MPGNVTVLCYITEHRKSSANSMFISDSSGVIRSRSLDSPLKIFLKGFYPQGTSEELSLPSFDVEDVVIATGKFRIVEYVNETNEKVPTLKMVLNDLVHLNIKPNNLPEFPILINMTAVVEEPPTISDDVTMLVIMHDHIDQDLIKISMKCYYSTSAPHLIHESKDPDKTNKTSVDQTIAERVNNNAKRTKITSSSEILSLPKASSLPKTVSPSEASSSSQVLSPSKAMSPSKVVSPSKASSSSKVQSLSKVSRSRKASSSSKTSSPPYKRTRNNCKVSDLAKEALANPDRLDTSSATSADSQLE